MSSIPDLVIKETIEEGEVKKEGKEEVEEDNENINDTNDESQVC